MTSSVSSPRNVPNRSTTPEPSTLAYSLADAELFDYVNSSLEEEERFHFFGFEFLQRLNLVQLQNDLISVRAEIQESRAQNYDKLRLRALLVEYGKLKDCDISKHSG